MARENLNLKLFEASTAVLWSATIIIRASTTPSQGQQQVHKSQQTACPTYRPTTTTAVPPLVPAYDYMRSLFERNSANS